MSATPDLLEGIWLPRAADVSGKVLELAKLRVARLVIGAHVYRILDHADHVVDSGEWTRNRSSTPDGLDLYGVAGPFKGRRIEALIALSGDSLSICYDMDGGARPLTMVPAPEQLLLTITYAREPVFSGADGAIAAQA